MNKKLTYSLLIILSFLFCVSSKAQINAGDDKEICYGETVWLKASVDDSFATPVFLEDDTVVGPVSIGFDFEFYGETYNEIYISSNGWISFTAPFPFSDSWNGGHSPRALPDNSDFVPKNCVMGAWQDWSPSYSGGVGYETSGTAPNRTLTVSFCQVAVYNCEQLTGTFQIVLRESQNYIDINLNNKPYCPDWYDGKAVLGVQNIDATDAVVAPGRNATQWLANEETWRFIPSGNSYDLQLLSSYIPVLSGTLSPISWYYDDVTPGNYIGTSDSIQVSPESTTTYIASVTLCGDLEFDDQVEVVVHPLPIADAGADQTIIVATNAILDGTGSQCLNGGCDYQWEPSALIFDDPASQTPTTVNLNQTTAFYLSMEDQFGCKSDSDMVIINVINGPLSLLLTADHTAVCSGNEVVITAIGGGGERPYTYEWTSVPAPPAPYPQDSFLIVYPQETTTYFCKITDFDGMSIPQESVTISVNNPSPIITGQEVVCENEQRILYTTPLHNNNSYFWKVITANGEIEGSNIDVSTHITWNGSGTGKVVLRETLPPPLGCISYDTLEVQVLERPDPLVTGPQTVCENQQGVVYETVDFQDRSYSWIADGGDIPTVDTNSFVVVNWEEAGYGQVIVTERLTIHPACKSSRTLDVNILPGPHPVITGPQEVCEQDFDVVYSGNMMPNTYSLWGILQNGEITGSPGAGSVYVNWLQSGDGLLLLSQTIDSSGCSAVSDTFRVSVHPKPQMTVSPESIDICQFEEVTLEASGADTISWFPVQGLSVVDDNLTTFVADTSVQYHVIGVNGFGCQDTAAVSVLVRPVPVVDLGGDRYIRENEPVVLFAGEGNDYYEWQDGSGGSEFTAYTGGEYAVYVEKNGCFATDTIIISPTMGAIPVPTAFTPNGDGLNDKFMLFGQLDKVEQFSMKIFARNGQMIFYTNDVYEGWNGMDTYGNPMPQGSYVYYVEFMEQGNPFDQGVVTKKGTITLMR